MKKLSLIIVTILSLFLGSEIVNAKTALFRCNYSISNIKKLIPSASGETISFSYTVYDDKSVDAPDLSGYSGGSAIGNNYFTKVNSINKDFYKRATEGSNHCPNLKLTYDGSSNVQLEYESNVVSGTEALVVNSKIENLTSDKEQQANKEETICSKTVTLKNGQVKGETITVEFFKIGTNKRYRVKSSLGDSSEGAISSYITVGGKTYNLGANTDVYYKSKESCESAPLFTDAEKSDDNLEITDTEPETPGDTGDPSGQLGSDESEDGPSVIGTDGDGYIGDNFCGTEEVIRALKMVGHFIRLAKFFVPLLIVAMAIFDMYKAVTAGKSDEVAKGGKQILVRLFLGILIFFVPNIIGSILGATIADKYKPCSNCLFFPHNDCQVIHYKNDTTPSDDGVNTKHHSKMCGYHGSISECNGDYKNFCEWDYSGNYCGVRTASEVRNGCSQHLEISDCKADTRNHCDWTYDGGGSCIFKQ